MSKVAAQGNSKQAAGKAGQLAPLRGAILDVDGTLLDSMPMWDRLAAQYLRCQGVQPEADVNERIKDLTVEEAGRYFQRHYGLRKTVPEIQAGVVELVRPYYAAEAELKPGAREFLEFLHQRQVPLCLATVTDAVLVQSALARLGLSSYFVKLLTCKEAGSKERPEIFLEARAALGTPLAATYVFEDSYYAMVTAKAAGFPVVAVYDTSAAADSARIKTVAAVYVKNLTETEHYLDV